MSATTVMHTEAASIIREGWTLLVEQMGILKATQFIMLLERGRGDTIQEIMEYWGNTGIEEIHRQVVVWNREKGKNS